MTHLEAENLASDYLEGELEQAQRADFEAHLGICSECRGLECRGKYCDWS